MWSSQLLKVCQTCAQAEESLSASYFNVTFTKLISPIKQEKGSIEIKCQEREHQPWVSYDSFSCKEHVSNKVNPSAERQRAEKNLQATKDFHFYIHRTNEECQQLFF